MSYKKLLANKLFDGKRLRQDEVLVTTAAGTVIEIIAAQDAGDDVVEVNGWLCPGFINTHCHVELSHMQGAIATGIGMVDFLKAVMFNRAASAETIDNAIQNACAAMHANGIVAVADICNTVDSLPFKKQSNIYWHNLIEVSGFVPNTAASRFASALETSSAFEQFFNSNQVSIVPHAPYSVSQNLLQLIANSNPALYSIHNQESEAELDFIGNKQGNMLQLFEAIGVNIDAFKATGTSSIEWYLPFINAAQKLILVHNCYTSSNEVRMIKDKNPKVSFCLCPNANNYIGNPLPNVDMLLQAGVNICIGTDSLASNHQLCILSELIALKKQANLLPWETLLQWATYNGAKAMDIEHQFGSFAIGLKPGIVLLKNMDNNMENATAEPFSL